MANTEWLRTFVAACQYGSISEAARRRHISQPAATAHIRSLETAAQTALLVRQRDGVVPTTAGSRLYTQLADPLERLDTVLAGLDRGQLPIPRLPLRVGASREVFAGLLAPAIVPLGTPVTAFFGSDDELRSSLVADELDLIVTGTQVVRRDVICEIVGAQRYALVIAARDRRPAPGSLAELATELTATPWVSYSHDLPTTRRFWKSHLNRPFDADVRLVASDLRVALSAVEAGVGASLMPTMVCGGALVRGSVRELFPVGELIDPRPLFLSARVAVTDLADVSALMREVRSLALATERSVA